MTRRGLREQVFKMLFRVEFHNVEDMPEQMNMFEEVEECSEKDKEYISNKFHNIVEKIDEIDAAINEVSEGWKTRRMGKVDLTLIRLAVYEMKYEDDIPVKVAINEAVELAKKYGINMPEDKLIMKAEAHALRAGGRSPRTARQFIEYLAYKQDAEKE